MHDLKISLIFSLKKDLKGVLWYTPSPEKFKFLKFTRSSDLLVNMERKCTQSPWKNYFLDPRMALWVDLLNDWCSSPPSMQPWVRYDCFLNVNVKYLCVSCADYRVVVVDTLYMWIFFSTSILNVCILFYSKMFFS